MRHRGLEVGLSLAVEKIHLQRSPRAQTSFQREDRRPKLLFFVKRKGAFHLYLWRGFNFLSAVFSVIAEHTCIPLVALHGLSECSSKISSLVAQTEVTEPEHQPHQVRVPGIPYNSVFPDSTSVDHPPCRPISC